ncbi:MAG: hypothetical protein ACYTG7_15575 [Planctomycetota bacterium]|jgi:hypothetical protein
MSYSRYPRLWKTIFISASILLVFGIVLLVAGMPNVDDDVLLPDFRRSSTLGNGGSEVFNTVTGNIAAAMSLDGRFTDTEAGGKQNLEEAWDESSARESVPPRKRKMRNKIVDTGPGGAGGRFVGIHRCVNRNLSDSAVDASGNPLFRYVWVEWTGKESSLYIENARLLDEVLAQEDEMGASLERKMAKCKNADIAASALLCTMEKYLDDYHLYSVGKSQYEEYRPGPCSLTPSQREKIEKFSALYYEKLKKAWDRATEQSGQTRPAPWDFRRDYDYTENPARFVRDVEQRRLFLEYIKDLIPEKELFFKATLTPDQWDRRVAYWEKECIPCQLKLF